MKIGDKVLCLNAEHSSPPLIPNGIYTVREIYGDTLSLANMQGNWMTSRFKLVPPQVATTFFGSSNNLIMPNTASSGGGDEATQDQSPRNSDQAAPDV